MFFLDEDFIRKSSKTTLLTYTWIYIPPPAAYTLYKHYTLHNAKCLQGVYNAC